MVLNKHKSQEKIQPTTYNPQPTTKGFTLVELLLYITVAGTVLIASTVFLGVLLESRIKNQTIAEVERQGLLVMDEITQAVRNAGSITSPATSTSAAALTLDMPTASVDPTVFDVVDGVIRVTEGGGSPVTLTNSNVSASNLLFENLSRDETPGTLRISFTLARNASSTRQEYVYERTFYTNASLR